MHVLTTSAQVSQPNVHQVIDANRYSSWKRLLRVTAYVLWFVRRSPTKRGLELDAEEMQSAEELWIKSIQSVVPWRSQSCGFEEEYSCSSSCKTVWSLHEWQVPLAMQRKNSEQLTQPRRKNSDVVTLKAPRHGFDCKRSSRTHVAQWRKYHIGHTESTLLDNVRETNH